MNASVRQALAGYVAPVLQVEPTLAAVSAAWPRKRKGAESSPLWRSQKGGRLSSQAIRRVIDELVHAASARGLVSADAGYQPTSSATHVKWQCARALQIFLLQHHRHHCRS